MLLIDPSCVPPLDHGFKPAVLADHDFMGKVRRFGASVVIGLERNGGELSRFNLPIYPEDHPDFDENFKIVERMVKFLLWQRGGFKLYLGGPKAIASHIRKEYSERGSRKFDFHFLGEKVYERDFSVIHCEPDEVPAANESGKHLGRNLNGYRIGFDLGASDRKVSAVVDGKTVFSEEVIWEPVKHADPAYHYSEIMAAIRAASEKMPRVDAIGGSSAGIYIDNRPMVGSIFRGVPPEKFGEIKNLFQKISSELGIPLEVLNDGDVTALAGSMAIGEDSVLGIALGSSEASGYVNAQGCITGWLNELAFAPIDYSPDAPVEEWSGDRGCGASYLSQQCVFRMCKAAGITLPEGTSDAEKLIFVQDQLQAGHEGAVKIWQSMGIYLGYALAHYADFYEIKHVLILGRCTSGIGGNLLLEGIKTVYKTEFPELINKMKIHLPDEKIRRVGQSVAAASLPIVE